MTEVADGMSGAGRAIAPALPTRSVSDARAFDTRWLGAILLLVLLCLWEASARLGWVDSAYWPPFTLVLRSAFYGLSDRDMLSAFASTIGLSAVGYAVASGVGITLGILLGMNLWMRYIILPIIESLRPIPAPAIIPPLILLLGVDDALKITIVALACFFPIFTNTYIGVHSVDDTLVQTARTFRLTWRATLIKVIFPATLPAIAAGLRTALSTALVVAVIVEMIAGASGTGYFIVQMQYAMRPDLMYAAVIYLAAIGYILNRGFLRLERRAIPWMGQT